MPDVGDVPAGKYRIEGSLGEGGMGLVYAAHHELLDKPVALKILATDAIPPAMLSGFIERFLAEARAAARVDSPHVARIMDVGSLGEWAAVHRFEDSGVLERRCEATTAAR